MNLGDEHLAPEAVNPDRTKTVVVKLGSATIAGGAAGGRLDLAAVDRLAADIAAARRDGWAVVVVSSGAVACGLDALGLGEYPRRVSLRQAAAAAGQPRLMRAWGERLNAFGHTCAQVLLTADDIDSRERFVNARRTVMTLVERGVVPVINENDSTSFEELTLGDNDRLAALVAGLVDADLLVLLTAADGLCEPGEGGVLGRVVNRVEDAASVRTLIADDAAPVSGVGVGGMRSKLDAAGLAVGMGIESVIASGLRTGVLQRVLMDDPAVGTRFVLPGGGESAADAHGYRGRKRWIAHVVQPRGTVIVDEGARRALVERGASLLPKGIRGVDVDLDFTGEPGVVAGDAVDVCTEGGPVFARGITAYSSGDIARIAGREAAEIEGVLGYHLCDEVIHRDDLVLLSLAAASGGARR